MKKIAGLSDIHGCQNMALKLQLTHRKENNMVAFAVREIWGSFCGVLIFSTFVHGVFKVSRRVSGAPFKDNKGEGSWGALPTLQPGLGGGAGGTKVGQGESAEKEGKEEQNKSGAGLEMGIGRQWEGAW